MSRRILVVDSDQHVRDLIAEGLTKEGYGVLLARSGE